MAVDVRASFTLQDINSIEASTFVYGQATDAATAAEIETDMQALCLALDKVVDDQITEIRVTIFPSLPPLNSTSTATQIKNAAATGSETERTGLFTFTAAGSLKRWSFNTPGLSSSASVVSNGKIVLTTTSFAQVLANDLIGGGTVLSYTNADSQPLLGLSRTRYGFHKHRKQRGKSSET